MKFVSGFRGVPDGEIYPVDYLVGDECPVELEAAALSLGVLNVVDELVQPPLVVTSGDPVLVGVDAPVVAATDIGGIQGETPADAIVDIGAGGQSVVETPAVKAKR